MSEQSPLSSALPAQGSAGALLRQAREAMGLPIEELAAVLKMAPRKIELLEDDRFDELPDPVFVRALAQSLCRSLRIEAAPVLALLPRTPGQRLDKIHGGLNAQYRDRPAQLVTDDWSDVAKPVIWGLALIVVAAALIYFFPTSWLSPARVSPRAATPVEAASGVGAEGPNAPAPAASTELAKAEPPARDAAPAVPPVARVPAAPPAPALVVPAAPAPATPGPATPTPAAAVLAAAPTATPAAAAESPLDKVAPPVSGVLQFRTSADSWIEVQDGRGVMLLSRGLEAGEAVGLNGAMPMKVTIGNVRATQVMFRGKAMDLALFTRDNIARFDLK